MKKKKYLSPQMKVVKVKAHQMLCISIPTSQMNESYQEVSEETTNEWF